MENGIIITASNAWAQYITEDISKSRVVCKDCPHIV